MTDNIGQQVLRVLEEKAAEGVEVRILYDAFGSHGTKSKRFQSSNQKWWTCPYICYLAKSIASFPIELP